MRSYFGFHAGGAFAGGFRQCVNWAIQEIERGVQLVSVATARPGDRLAAVIAEVDCDSITRVSGGSTLEVKRLLRMVEKTAIRRKIG